MSCNYADGLSPYENKGKLGLKEIFDSKDKVIEKVKLLADWIKSSKHVVLHTGAGISTSAGIPDFRGPNGVWTLEQKGIKPEINTSFDEAVPTFTHMAIVALVKAGLVHYVVTQNIDGLHLKSGLERQFLAELHGNMFAEECILCKRRFVRNLATTSVGQKCLGTTCRKNEIERGRPCRGKLYDTILDWEAGLPENDLDMAYHHASVADLNICLGTTLQIVPSGNLPLRNRSHENGKMVICNLQPTKHDKKADLIINTYVDDMMRELLVMLGVNAEAYSVDSDPTKTGKVIDWTIHDKHVTDAKKLFKLPPKKRIKLEHKPNKDDSAEKTVYRSVPQTDKITKYEPNQELEAEFDVTENFTNDHALEKVENFENESKNGVISVEVIKKKGTTVKTNCDNGTL